MKFEGWWRRIYLFLKSNRVTATDDKITAVLVQLRRGVTKIYVQKKIDQIEEEERKRRRLENITNMTKWDI